MDEFRQQGAYDEPGLSDRLDDIVFRCRLDPFQALADEYKRRVRDVKQAQFLGNFLERHPGIQHKAGVPLGGTFILVYHGLPQPTHDSSPPRTRPNIGFTDLAGSEQTSGRVFEFDEAKAEQLDVALARLQYKPQLAEDPDLQFVYQIFTGNLLVPKLPVSNVTDGVYLDTIAKLADGTVIADFFLPYECCSDCAPIEYRLPSARLRVSAGKACTNSDGIAEVTLTTEGASGSLSAQVDGGAFEELTGTLLLDAGDHTIVVRDDTGNESSPVEITIPAQLLIGGSETTVDEAAGTYQVVFTVEGGSAPYLADSGTIVDSTYTSPAVPVAEELTVVITDAAACTVEGTFESGVEPCALPCDGVAVRQGYRFWLPEAREQLPINRYTAKVGVFAIVDPDGNRIDLTGEVNDIINKAPQTIPSASFAGLVQRWTVTINKLVAEKVGSDQWFQFDYEAAPETGTTGALFVDRITCLDFDFELTVAFVQGQRERSLELLYNTAGTVVVDQAGDSKFRIPPFGGSTSNKCRPDEPPVPQCDGTELKLEIQHNGAVPDAVLLAAAVSGSDDRPVAFLWEVQDGVPSLAGGDRVTVTFNPIEPTEKRVRLTAYTEKGCTVTIDEVIDMARSGG